MLIPGNLDLSTWRNADFEMIFGFATNAGGSTPIDLTGATFTMQVRAQPKADGGALLALAIGSGLTILDAPGGRLRAYIGKATMETLPYDSNPFAATLFYYDLVGTPAGGVLSIFLQGRFYANPVVTR